MRIYVLGEDEDEDEEMVWKKIMIKLKRFVFSLSLIFPFFCPQLYAGTNISFSNNISGEFPNAAIYNNFINGLSSTLNNAMKFNTIAVFNAGISAASAQIFDEVDKFNFTFNFSMMFYSPSGDNAAGLEKLTYKTDDNLFFSGANFNFGFKLKDGLFIYSMINFTFNSTLSLGSNLLWKFFEKKENEKLFHRLYFSPSLAFTFLVKNRKESIIINTSNDINSFPYVNNHGSYSFDNGNGSLILDYPVQVYKYRHLIFSMDFSLKYQFKYSFFGVNVACGATLHINKAEQHFNVLTANVDYIGTGSPTGINTTLEVKMSNTWVSFLPHISIGLEFEYAGFVVRAPFISFIYVPIVKAFIIQANFGFSLKF